MISELKELRETRVGYCTAKSVMNKRRFPILTILVFLVLVSSGCTSYQRKQLIRQISNIFTGINPTVPAKPVSQPITNFIKQASKNKGQTYINQQIANRQPVSRTTLTEVIFRSILEEVEKTGQQVSRAMVRDEAITIASVLLSQNEDQAEVVE